MDVPFVSRSVARATDFTYSWMRWGFCCNPRSDVEFLTPDLTLDALPCMGNKAWARERHVVVCIHNNMLVPRCGLQGSDVHQWRWTPAAWLHWENAVPRVFMKVLRSTGFKESYYATSLTVALAQTWRATIFERTSFLSRSLCSCLRLRLPLFLSCSPPSHLNW